MKFHIPQDSIMTRRLPTEEMRFLRLVVVFDLRFHASQSLPITPLQHEILLTSFHLSVYFFYHSPLLSIQSLSGKEISTEACRFRSHEKTFPGKLIPPLRVGFPLALSKWLRILKIVFHIKESGVLQEQRNLDIFQFQVSLLL
eukprot:TRINITY_DN4674_c0_g1_i2.p1 TRINITY_DN4674_c0_g1~~TRINITY_DN4674_c0_g1_i2.p1  ORF type:complete len:143 (-),score=14.75 TRINITY_DN4674_c0_g1_i2:236-664(-)